MVASPALFSFFSAVGLIVTGNTNGGGVGRVVTTLVTPAQVLGVGGIGLMVPLRLPLVTDLSGIFACWPFIPDARLGETLSLRKMWSKLITPAPVVRSPGTMADPSMIATRRVT